MEPARFQVPVFFLSLPGKRKEMSRTTYRKKTKNGITYFFKRVYHENLYKPRDLYARTAKELTEKIKRLEYELDHGVSSDNAVFGEYLEHWMETVCFSDKKESTKKDYRAIYKNYIKNYKITKIKVKKLTAFDVQNHYKEMVEKGASKERLRKAAKLINPCIRYAFNQGKIMTDFSKSVIMPDAPERSKNSNNRRPSKAMTIDDENRLLEAVQDTYYACLVFTALNTGMRKGELLALTWDDIDFEERTISVNKSYNSKLSKDQAVNSPKTNAGNRIIPIPEKLLIELKKHKSEQNTIRLMVGNKFENKNIVFSKDNGDYISTSTLDRFLKKCCAEAGIENYTMHDFRDTYATRLYEKTRDLKMIQYLLGHADFSTTADIYTHVTVDESHKFIDSAIQ